MEIGIAQMVYQYLPNACTCMCFLEGFEWCVVEGYMGGSVRGECVEVKQSGKVWLLRVWRQAISLK